MEFMPVWWVALFTPETFFQSCTARTQSHGRINNTIMIIMFVRVRVLQMISWKSYWKLYHGYNIQTQKKKNNKITTISLKLFRGKKLIFVRVSVCVSILLYSFFGLERLLSLWVTRKVITPFIRTPQARTFWRSNIVYCTLLYSALTLIYNRHLGLSRTKGNVKNSDITNTGDWKTEIFPNSVLPII